MKRKSRWVGIPKEQVKQFMADIARKKWVRMTKKQRSEHGKMMVNARIRK